MTAKDDSDTSQLRGKCGNCGRRLLLPHKDDPGECRQCGKEDWEYYRVEADRNE